MSDPSLGTLEAVWHPGQPPKPYFIMFFLSLMLLTFASLFILTWPSTPTMAKRWVLLDDKEAATPAPGPVLTRLLEYSS